MPQREMVIEGMTRRLDKAKYSVACYRKFSTQI